MPSSSSSVPPPRTSEPPANTRSHFTALLLFVLTFLSVYRTGALQNLSEHEELTWHTFLRGWTFALPLLAILLFHEFGHYIAARIHKVPASLPHFIPFPWSPFGTMGAIIGMKGRIASRKALLDIGASGPLAGLLVTIPVLVIGLRLSPVQPLTPDGLQEGQSLLYWLLKRVVVGPIPDGHDVFLHPVAFAGWGGLFLTMINLLPIGQLDGGHVAYALFGKKQHRIARIVHTLLPLLFLYNLGSQLLPLWKAGLLHNNEYLSLAFSNSLFWLFWYGILFVMFRLGGRDHPETDPGPLGKPRTIIAALTLVFFVLLFMPTPMAANSPLIKEPQWTDHAATDASSSRATPPSSPGLMPQPSTSCTPPPGSTPPSQAKAFPSAAHSASAP